MTPYRISSILFLAMLLIFCEPAAVRAASPPDEISLAGEWRFALDPTDVGESERWFARDLPGRIRLPGVLQAQGFGDPPSSATKWTANIGKALLKEPKYAPYQRPGDFKLPFWLTPERTYVGAAWYQRDIEIPESWKDRFIVFLERPHWVTTVWIDHTRIPSYGGAYSSSLGTPHAHLSEAPAPGRHRLTIRVDNRVEIPVGNDAHSVSDQTQGNWNGIVGRIALKPFPRLFPEGIQLYPDVENRKVRLVYRIRPGELTAEDLKLILEVSAESFNTLKAHRVAAEEFEFIKQRKFSDQPQEYSLGPDALLWDEFSPALYRLTLKVKDPDGQVRTSQTVTFGMRELSTSGTQFTINGRRLFLRGTLDCCIYPKTGHPPMDVESWKRVLTAARAHGLNHIRFHSWCPPEAAFVAADEMGFYFQVEASCWASFGNGSPVDKWIHE